MKISLKLLAALLLCVVAAHQLPAQEKTIRVSGVVTDSKAKPVPGITIVVQGSAQKPLGTTTDKDGKYAITVPLNSTLSFSGIGYETQTVKASKPTINVSLADKDVDIDEVVVVGYGQMKKRDITGSIASVSDAMIESRMPTNIFEALQGQVAGVDVVAGSGAPGSDAQVRVRGTATFEAGALPLYVVDGIPVEDINDINPYDIKSIEILKDAASAAIYGSRSANGVFLITTKAGDKARKLDIRYLRSYSKMARKMPVANGDERRFYDQVRRELTDGAYGLKEYDPYAFMVNNDWDFQDLIFRTAIRDEVNLSASGGSDRFKLMFSGGFLNENGVIVNSNYKRLSSRLNAEYRPNQRFTVGSRVSFTYTARNGISESGVLTQLLERVPYWAALTPSGAYVPNINNRNNPLAVAMDDIDKTYRFQGTMYNYLKYNITPKLSLHASIQGSYYHNTRQQYRPSPQLGQTDRTTGKDISILSYNWANENYLSYNTKIGGSHNISAMAGCSFQQWDKKNTNVVGMDYTSDFIYTLNAASGFDARNTYTLLSGHSMASFFGRVSYDYKGRYLFNTNIRWDGSSRFGSEQRWGFFPSASAGWRFSDEKFMKWMKPVVSDAKLRFSWGRTGNESIGDYDAWLLYSPDFIYQDISGIGQTQMAYPGLSWEETEQYNAGLDLNFAQNRVRVVLDYYWKNTTDLLNKVQVPKETGFSTVRKNVGAMTNEGIEFSIGADLIRTKNFSWSVDFNIAHNKNKITKIADGIPFYKGTSDAIYIQEGRPLGEFWGYKYLGIFAYDESNAFTDNWERLTPVFDNGQFRGYTYKGYPYTGNVRQKKDVEGQVLRGGDIDYEANSDGVVDLSCKQKIGCAQPDFFGGFGTNFRYKDFGLYIALSYSIGGDIYNYAESRRNAFRYDGCTPSPDAIAGMWTKPGDQATYPAPTVKTHNYTGPSSFFIEDGSYIKLRTVKLSYNLPAKFAKKVGMKGALIYVYGNNLLTFTDYSGYTPEFSTSDPLVMGIDTNRYPFKKEIGFGINLNF